MIREDQSLRFTVVWGKKKENNIKLQTFQMWLVVFFRDVASKTADVLVCFLAVGALIIGLKLNFVLFKLFAFNSVGSL